MLSLYWKCSAAPIASFQTILLITSASWAELPLFTVQVIENIGLCKAHLQVKQKFMKIPCCNFPFILPVRACVEQPDTTATTLHTVKALDSVRQDCYQEKDKKSTCDSKWYLRHRHKQMTLYLTQIGQWILSEMCLILTLNLQHCKTITNVCCAWSQFCC